MSDDRLACRLCSAPQFTPLCDKEGTRYVRCDSCGVVRQYPYPTGEEISRYYEEYRSKKSSHSPYLSDAGFEPFKRDKLFTFSDLGVTPESFRGKSVCDVGCATGQFLELLEQIAHPKSLIGIDVSEECIAAARKRNLNCVRGDFLTLSASFDVITMWHLIEHLPFPGEYIRHASTLLAPGGMLLVETPVTGEVSEAFGAQWRFLMPFEHINLLSPDALFRLCREHGLELKSSIRFGSGNDSGTVPPPNKRAMDIIAKRLGFGDTLAACFVRT